MKIIKNMWRIFFKISFISALVTVAADAQTKIPIEVQKVMNDYIHDSTTIFNFYSEKLPLGLDPSLRLTDIQAGIPIEVYHLRNDVLDTCGNDIPVAKLIDPVEVWLLPIRVKGQYIYQIKIAKKDGKWLKVAMDQLRKNNLWQQFRAKYPESSGINPILIYDGQEQYLFFPQKKRFNFFYIKYGNWKDDMLVRNTSNSIDSLDEDRKFIKYLIQKGKDTKAARDAFLRNHPNDRINSKQTDNKGGEQ